jgi:hypothetical protein
LTHFLSLTCEPETGSNCADITIRKDNDIPIEPQIHQGAFLLGLRT